jgi:hypothetical protein
MKLWAEHVARLETRNTYRILLGKPLGRRQVRSHIRRLEDGIKLDLKGDRFRGLEVDGTGSVSCPMKGTGISEAVCCHIFILVA